MKEVKWFFKLCKDIESLKIQGAERVARAGIEGVARLMHEQPNELKPYVDRLLAARPTEPMLRNGVAFFLAHADKKNCRAVLHQILDNFDSADERIARYASGLIKNGHAYFTHCHSTTVTRAFIHAWRQGKRFSVHTTETRPLFQGRLTAAELSSASIPVVHYVDSAARVALKRCSAVFIGADALLADAKVANKIGSEMVAELAFNRGIPLYVLANSWKYVGSDAAGFKEKLELRKPGEVWKNPPKGVRVENPAFELVMPKYVTAIITEHGIMEPRSAISTIKRRLARFIDDK